MNKNRLKKISIYVSFLLLLPVLAQASAVAMLTDKQGSVNMHGKELELFTELDKDSLIVVDKGAKLTLVYLESGQEYLLQGPLSLTLSASSPISNKEPIKPTNTLHSANSIVASSANYSQAAIVMRAGAQEKNALNIIQPQKTKVLNRWPELSWKPIGKGYTYRIELLTADGDILYEAETESSLITIPKDINLPENSLITWEIEAINDMESHINSAEFLIVKKNVADVMMQAKPKSESFSQMAYYATILEKNGFNAEAQKYWFKLSQLRPYDETIKNKLQ